MSDHLLLGALQGGSALYGGVTRLRNLAYDRGWFPQVRIPCPVVSVGNLTVGGTGKTACVELLAEKFLRLGRAVAILSRGYAGRRGGTYWLKTEGERLLLNGGTVATDGGLPDEPQLLARHLEGVPIGIGSRRERTGREAISQHGAEIAILDDGMQYRRLHRDCEIVLVNGRMPLSGWPLLPRGPMREPLTSLRRADVILITKVDESLHLTAALQERLRAFNPQAVTATALHEPVQLRDGRTDMEMSLERLSRSRVALISSIGDPEGFEQTARRLGTTIEAHRAYPDHHAYEPAEWQGIVAWAASLRVEAVVTTEKDFIRLRPLLETSDRLPVWVLRIRMRILDGEARLDDRLAAVCAR